MVNFAQIRSRAETRKGGAEALQALLPEIPSNSDIAKVRDDRCLAEMAKCVFRSGFSWKVVEAKWPDFETVFMGFEPKPLLFQPDEYWDDIASDKRIIRHGAKIASVRHNAGFVADIAEEHGSFGTFLSTWPDDDIVGLWSVLAKRGKRLGGNTGRYFLRFIGMDCFLPSADVVAALRSGGLEIAPEPTSKRDLTAMQREFNAWHQETGLPYVHLSRICAMAAGENYDAELLRARMSMADDE